MSWLAPWFLLGLVGVGLPYWLHRFARQTDEKQPFASLMFLEASEIRRSRRHELRYWLLLALRLALVALLALAFAGPLWRLAANSSATGTATLHVVVLDTSMSMHQQGAWGRAQERARELVTGLRGADRAMLVAADHRLRVLQEPVFAAQRGLLVAAVDALEPGYSRLDYGALMTGSAAWGAGPGERVVLHLVTDLQQSASPLRFADLQPPPGVTLDLVDAGAGAVASLRVADVAVAEREADAILVRVDGSQAAASGREVALEVNGVERGRQQLAPDAVLPLTLRFAVGDLGEGEHRVAARLSPADGLQQDDAFFALVRRVQPRVLLVAASASGDDATYLRAALQSLANPRFQVEAAAPGALATRALDGFAAVVVSDAGVMSEAGVRELRRFVEAGGAALVTLGPRALQRGGEALTGATLAGGGARNAGNRPARVAEVEQSHPVLRDPAGWRSIRFFRHVPVSVPEGASVLLRFDNGAPLLLEQPLGNGRVLTLTSPLAREWNDLAIHPLFVRFVAEATVHLAGARAEAATARVGSAIEADFGGRTGGQVFDPDGRRALMLGGTAGSPRLVPDRPGYYEVRGGGRSDFIAVNVDPRESRLERLEPAAVERWLAMKPRAAEAAATAPAAPGAPVPAARWLPLWFWLLLGATLLAFLEPLVANYHLHVLRERRE